MIVQANTQLTFFLFQSTVKLSMANFHSENNNEEVLHQDLNVETKYKKSYIHDEILENIVQLISV